MPIRTDVSEDLKGDPTKVIPHQPEPGAPREDVEPLLPRQNRKDAHKDAAPPGPGQAAQTPADRRGLGSGRKKA
jgi:hypothetical protein